MTTTVTLAGLDPWTAGRVVVSAGFYGAALLAVVGLLLLQANLVGERWRAVRHGVSLVGAMLVLLAFTQVGHTRSDPRMGVLLFLHLLLAAFWLAALMPLYRLAGHERDIEQSARLLGRFGRFGLVLIPLLLIAGGGLVAWLMDGRPARLLGSGYGQVLSVKLVLVALLLVLGAGNKWWLVPAVRRAVPGARRRLRRSIATEAVLMSLLLLTVALLFTTTPPMG